MGNKAQKPELRKTSTTDKTGNNEEIGKDLKKFLVLSKYSDDERAKMGAFLTPKVYKVGEHIFKEGEEGTGFYLLTQGEVSVHKFETASQSTVQIGLLKEGDYFGETALIHNQPRGATVTATKESVCYYLDRKDFEKLFRSDTLHLTFAKRAAISAEPTRSRGETKPSGVVTTKSEAQRELILKAIHNNVLFLGLSDEQKEAVLDEMYLAAVSEGTVLIKQGDQGDTFYVVESGAFDIIVNGNKVSSRTSGTAFGELALMYNAPRAATVAAAADSVVWAVHREAFRRVVALSTEAKYAEYLHFLKSVELLTPLAAYEREKLAELLEEVSYPAKSVVFSQGDPGTAMYFIRAGEVIVTKDAQETSRLGPGAYFGERALLRKDVRAATVHTNGPTVLLKLDQEAFSLLLGPLEDVMHRKIATDYDVDHRPSSSVQGQARSPAGGSGSGSGASGRPAEGNGLDASLKFENLKVLGTLGKGSFGYVQLVEDNASGRTFALKAVNKATIVETGQQSHVMSEKNAMTTLDHPFIIKLYQTFKDRERLYFLLEPVLGGELFTLLRSKQQFEPPAARFYAATVVLIFEYMHSLDIIYRDLKPENILIDHEGFLKLTDFGFAKKLTSPRTSTLCGTPDYLAPEIVSGKGHGKGVDWWTLGILIYEMLASTPPFYDEDPMNIYAKIVQGEIEYPPYFSKHAVSIIKKLLHPKATRRLGVIKGGAKGIKDHPWFEGFDFDALFHRKLQPPFVREVQGPNDLSNFKDVAGELPDVAPSYIEDSRFPDWDADF